MKKEIDSIKLRQKLRIPLLKSVFAFFTLTKVLISIFFYSLYDILRKDCKFFLSKRVVRFHSETRL
jgi:hypothetical protein